MHNLPDSSLSTDQFPQQVTYVTFSPSGQPRKKTEPQERPWRGEQLCLREEFLPIRLGAAVARRSSVTAREEGSRSAHWVHLRTYKFCSVPVSASWSKACLLGNQGSELPGDLAWQHLIMQTKPQALELWYTRIAELTRKMERAEAL